MVATTVPSRCTVAIPHCSHLKPTQLTPVPLNVKLAVAPTAPAYTPWPPLNVTPVPALVICDQAPAGASVAAVSSKRVVGGGDEFDTVTATADEVVRLPAASRATAVSACEPFPTVVVFQETEYGEVVSSGSR